MNKFVNADYCPDRPRFKLGGCRRRGGDGFLDCTDGGEWRCLQCARPVPDESSVDIGLDEAHRRLFTSGDGTSAVFAQY